MSLTREVRVPSGRSAGPARPLVGILVLLSFFPLNRGQLEVFVGEIALCNFFGALLPRFEITYDFTLHFSVAVRLEHLRHPPRLRVFNLQAHMASPRLGGSRDALS